jgi:hypothetical protein
MRAVTGTQPIAEPVRGNYADFRTGLWRFESKMAGRLAQNVRLRHLSPFE